MPRHPKSTYASETPATDGERLYVLFGDIGLYCYDLDGKPLWSRRIESKKTFWLSGARLIPGDRNNPNSYKVRRAKVGGYRDYFDDQQTAQIDRMVETTLSPLFGYTVDGRGDA